MNAHRRLSGSNAAVRVTTDDGVDLAVHEWGGSRRPIVLGHPTGFHGRIWAPTAELLVERGHRVVSFDFRGHGDSGSDPSGEYHWARFALDSLAVAKWIDDEHLVAAGHSKGAAALLLSAADHPAMYRAIWAFEPIVFPAIATDTADHDFPLAVGARKRRNEWSGTEEAFASYMARPPMNVMDPRCVLEYVDHGLRDRGNGVWELKCAPTTEAAVYTMGPVNGAWARLPEVGVPVRLLCGADSRDMSPRLIERLAARIAKSSVEIWQGHGHFGPQADPFRTAASITAFATLVAT
jgi:pimeloyl-ACP methyl ester carboxylesterase